MIQLTLNGEEIALDLEPETPLLWVVRDELDLPGTKFGCGIGQCGACTIHLDGQPVRGCLTPLSAAAGRTVTTIEGLSPAGDHPLQRAWVKFSVPQCGYCQSGQLMTAAALLESNPTPSDEQIDAAMAGNLCRCGTYDRIRNAVRHVARAGDEATDAPGDDAGSA